MDVPTQRYSTYPHPIPIQRQVFPTYRIRTARQTPLSPRSTNSHPPYLPYIYPTHPTPLPSQLYSNQPDPTLDHIKNAPYTIPQTDTHYPLPTRPTLTPQPDPTTPPYPPHILLYPPNPHPSYPYMLTPPQRLISPSKAHMSLGRFCCALTIEYKCKTSHINKRL